MVTSSSYAQRLQPQSRQTGECYRSLSLSASPQTTWILNNSRPSKAVISDVRDSNFYQLQPEKENIAYGIKLNLELNLRHISGKWIFSQLDQLSFWLGITV